MVGPRKTGAAATSPLPHPRCHRFGSLPPCRGRDFLGNHGHADGRERDPGELQVLPAERDTDDGHKVRDGATDVPQRQPDPGADEPDDVADGAQGAGADVVDLLEFTPADRLLPEGEEREVAHDEAGPAPRDADDGDVGDDARQPPGESHEDSTKDEPEKI